MDDIRTGLGYDVHRLEENRPLILGGVKIDYAKGLAGHSDADVLLHAITDALFGALALGDIGSHFPAHDDVYKDIDSRKLLREAYRIISTKGWKVGNVDATISAQEPPMAPHIEAMRSNISSDLEVDTNRISVKATTTEELGFEGRKEGIAARAAVLVLKSR